LNVKHYIPFDGGRSKYSKAAIDAREHLILDHHWDIIDGGRNLTVLGFSLLGVFSAISVIGFCIIKKRRFN